MSLVSKDRAECICGTIENWVTSDSSSIAYADLCPGATAEPIHGWVKQSFAKRPWGQTKAMLIWSPPFLENQIWKEAVECSSCFLQDWNGQVKVGGDVSHWPRQHPCFWRPCGQFVIEGRQETKGFTRRGHPGIHKGWGMNSAWGWVWNGAGSQNVEDSWASRWRNSAVSASHGCNETDPGLST